VKTPNRISYQERESICERWQGRAKAAMVAKLGRSMLRPYR